MKRCIRTLSLLALVCGLSGLGQAARAQDANAILDKAIQALGGEGKLSKAKVISWKAKGTITFMGSDNPVSTQTTVQSLDHIRQEFEGEFGGMPIKALSVLADDKGWREFGGNRLEMDKEAVANEKRSIYLTVIPITILPLKDKAFKVEALGEEKVGDRPAVGVKATGPDGKEFSLYFDKESGLPVKLVAKVIGFVGEEFTQETTFSDYKEMAGIQKATKIQSKRDGERFIEQEITEFKIHEQVDPKVFTEP